MILNIFVHILYIFVCDNGNNLLLLFIKQYLLIVLLW